jgi:hypothetical protein
MSTEGNKAATREALLADLEDLWGCFDELIAGFRPPDWARKHGPGRVSYLP